MQARIVRGTPPSTSDRKPVWQLETRPGPKGDWSRLYGSGHTSTSKSELIRTAERNAWTVIPDDAP